MVPYNERPLVLTCKFDDNPRTTLEAMFTIMGITVPTDWLNDLFRTDYTTHNKSLLAIMKEHNAQDYFKYRDYYTAVNLHNLEDGLPGCFKGGNDGNFDKNGFTITTPLLCQMEIDGNLVQTNPDKHYQWVI